MTQTTVSILDHCKARRVQGAIEYGHMTFFDYDCYSEAKEEGYDIINYLLFEVLRIDRGDGYNVEEYEDCINYHTALAINGTIGRTENIERIYELIRTTIRLLEEVELLRLAAITTTDDGNIT